jgi:hypothetical protein
MTPQQIAKQIRCNLFAESATIEDATANAYNLIHTLRPQDRATALQALHVFANTVANAITTTESEPLKMLRQLVEEADATGGNRRTVTRYSIDKARAILTTATEEPTV